MNRVDHIAATMISAMKKSVQITAECRVKAQKPRAVPMATETANLRRGKGAPLLIPGPPLPAGG